MSVTIDDIRAAATLLDGAIVKTPTARSRVLSALCGCDVVLKFENLQYTASFKDRGALVKLASLTEKERRAGIIAVSAGNHAQGVAYHAERLGIPATIVMPKDTPFNKIQHTEAFGARVVLQGDSLDESLEHATALRESKKLTFVHPYDDEAIVAGQGTVALEMLEAAPEIDVLVVPVGGGGLIAGMAIAAKALKPEIEIVGVEAALYPSMYEALRGTNGRSGGQTIAEGIAVKAPGEITRPIVEARVDDIVLVDETGIEEAVRLYIEIEKSVVEGAGAASLAAVLANRDKFAGRTVGLVVSGGNIDSRLLASILMRGLVRDGRMASVRVEISDAPGALAKVARLIGDNGGNIIEIYHQRLFHDVPVKMAELDVVIETRDAAHVRDIIGALGEAGFPTRLLSSTAAEPSG